MPPAHLAKPPRGLLPEHIRAERKEPQMGNTHPEIVGLGLNAVESAIQVRLPAPSRQPASVAGYRAFGPYLRINTSYPSEHRCGEKA